jgi:PKD repeat protein
VPYRVHHAGGVAEVIVNQRENGGKWISLGTHPFAAGSPAHVVVSGENGPVCADAVKFEQIPPIITTLTVLGISATSDDLTLLVVPKQGPAPLAVEGFVLDLPAGETAEWDFGDGTTATGENVTHTFESPGTYTVKVRAGAATGEETVVVTGE